MRAAKMVDDILAKHQPAPLPAEVQTQIKEIVRREQARIDSQA
jgi:trimethylamine:corrinoid methyltransferase-like protein